MFKFFLLISGILISLWLSLALHLHGGWLLVPPAIVLLLGMGHKGK